MKKKDLFLGGGILFAACVLFLVMNLMQYVQAKESGQKEIQEKQVVIKVAGEVYVVRRFTVPVPLWVVTMAMLLPPELLWPG